MRITNYDNAVIEFCCDACNFLGEMDTDRLARQCKLKLI